MNREKLFLSCLSDIKEINLQANGFLEKAGVSNTGTVGNLNQRREAMRSFRVTLGEMKWLCLQMEIVLAEAPFAQNASNDQHR